MLSKVSLVRPSVSRGMIKRVMPFKSVFCPEVRAEKIKCEHGMAKESLEYKEDEI